MKYSVSIFLSIFLLIATGLHAQSPYEFKKGADISIGANFIVFGAASVFAEKKDSPLTTEAIFNLNHEDVFFIDRSATRQWSPVLASVSDAGLLLSIVSPAFLMFSEDMRKDAGIIGTMTAENIFTTLVFTTFTKATTGRTRPYAYNPEVPESFKLKQDAQRSFFSGHTSLAFCSAVLTSTIFSKYYPDSSLKPWVWGTTLTLAGTTGLLRYFSGKHFPTDIIAGAIVGSAVGYCIPKLHEKQPETNPGQRTFSVRLVFAL